MATYTVPAYLRSLYLSNYNWALGHAAQVNNPRNPNRDFHVGMAIIYAILADSDRSKLAGKPLF